MIKTLKIVLLLLLPLTTIAQEKYILFEDGHAFDTVKVGSFKLLNNHVTLSLDSESRRAFNILNLYFSKYDFKAHGLDSKAFSLAINDGDRLNNDVLITLTPLTDSLGNKIKKMGSLKNLEILRPEELLQIAIRNLHRCFTENDVAKDDIPGVIKSLKYRVIIRKRNSYYLVTAPVLTEFYLIDRQSYLFPSQYHYGEINIGDRSQTTYFNGFDIDSILHKTMSGTSNDYYPIRTIARKTYISSGGSVDGLNSYTYWSFPTYTGGLPGIGRFQFIEGVGIINGTYGNYFDKHFLVTLENNNLLEDHNGPFRMKVLTINGLDLKQYAERINSSSNKGIIKPSE